jgi:hypothetical protein
VRRKIPGDAYSFYLGLGQARSYEAVARRYQVSKRAVTNLARKEAWQQKVAAADEQARVRAVEKAQESIEEMNDRHLKTMQLVQKKALEALRQTTIVGAMDAVRALAMAVRDERLIRGEPTDRNAVNIEEVIRREYERWMVPAGRGVDPAAEAGAHGNGTS